MTNDPPPLHPPTRNFVIAQREKKCWPFVFVFSSSVNALQSNHLLTAHAPQLLLRFFIF